MFLCKVRQGFLEQDLATRFNVSQSTVSTILITWVNYLYVMLGSLPIWWSCAAVQIDMPQCFQQTYPNKNVFSRIDKIYFTNASALAMKYGTCRAKPAGSALCVSLFCPHVTLFRSHRSILTRPPSRQNCTTILIAYNNILLYFI